MSVTLAAEKASTPQHGEKCRVRVSAVLARKKFIGEKSEHREIEPKPTRFTSKGWWGVNLGCTNALARAFTPGGCWGPAGVSVPEPGRQVCFPVSLLG